MKRILFGLLYACALMQAALFATAATAQTPAPLFNWGSDPASQYWSIYVGGMYLNRSRPDSSAIATPPTGTPGVLIDAGSFDFNWKSLPEIAVQRKFDGGWTLEGRYFNMGSETATTNVPSVTTFRIAGIGVTVLGGGALDNTYSSSLRSTEFNVYKQLTPGFAVLAGYRNFSFQDHLHVGLVGTGLNISDWNVSNHLNGGQIGLSLTLLSPGVPLVFNATAKTGWYSTSINDSFTSQVVSRASDSASKTAQVSELGLTATYQIANNFALRGGYTLIWMDSVGLASEGGPRTVQAAGGTQTTIGTGNVFFQGASFGAVITF